MSITTLGLIESLIQHDRPSAWWGLDTADPTVDDSDNGYTLTALAAPANSASLFTRGDTGASGCRDFNGTTQGYWTNGSVTTVADGPPPFHDAASASMTSATTTVISPGGIKVGDLLLYVSLHSTAAATVTTGPTGYTQVGSTLNAGTHAVAVYKKTAVQADTVPQEVSLVWNSSADVLCSMLVYRGLDTSVSGLIFDSGQQATASATFHSTTTETFPDASHQLVFWTKNAFTQISPDPTNMELRVYTFHSNQNLELQAVEYNKTTAGSGFRISTTTSATQLGAITITFGSPPKVLDDTFDTLTGNLAIQCAINVDTVAAGSRTIVRKEGSWILQVDTATLKFFYHDGTAYRSHSGPTLSTATTYRIFVKDDGSNITFYVNGTKTTVARFNATAYATNANRITLGHFWNGAAASEFLDGRIDELALYASPTVFTDQQILTHEIAATTGVFGDYITADKSGRYPRVKLELAVTSKPTDVCHSFSNVTGLTRVEQGITCQRGRNFELDRMDAGTLGFVLANRDRAFDSLKPRRVVRLRAQVTTDGVVFPIFFGYTEAPRHGRPEMGIDSTVILTATDAFKALSVNKINDTLVRPSEMPGVRIAAVLEDVDGLPSSIEAGVHEIIGDNLQGINRLDHCQGVAETDGGIFFCDARGRAVFQDSQHRSKFERSVRATYGGVNTSAPFPCTAMEPEVDETRLYTAAAVTPASGVVQRAENDAAALEYFPLTKEVSTLHSVDSDALAMATHIVNAYSVPLTRIQNFSVQPSASPSYLTMWATVLAHEVSHRIKIIEKPIGGSEVSRELFIEGISHRITASDWRIGLPASPTELEGKYFIVGTSKIGDANAVIGW